MNRKRKAEKMLKLISAWRDSGLTQAEFAKSHKIKLHMFRYWVTRSRQLKTDTSGFLELNSIPAELIFLRFPNGVELSVPSNTPVSFIRELVNI
jgi:hypothetical protein